MSIFMPANILLPKSAVLSSWAVIACDQFTSDPDYWKRVRQNTEDVPSTMHMILPEAELGCADEGEKIENIHETMRKYLDSGVFTALESAYVYVERTLADGSIRQGLVGMIDLEAYDYKPGSVSPIRATEKTVLERIPPRMRVRQGAALEFPHILMLCDDERMSLIEPIGQNRDSLPKLYDFSLMEGGGRITGHLVQGTAAQAFDQRLARYCAAAEARYRGLGGAPVVFAVGDGNHSLATAKSCYEALKASHPGEDLSHHPARYALVELENIHSPALRFEPIHRVLTGVDTGKLLDALSAIAGDGCPISWRVGEKTGVLRLNTASGALAVAVLQPFLDQWLRENPGAIDYIHGEDEVARLAAQENAIGLLLPPMGKSELFRGVVADGVLPRKTFSMGHAQEKRYYLEGRKIL